MLHSTVIQLPPHSFTDTTVPPTLTTFILSVGDETYRRERQRTAYLERSVNSVSTIDTVSRIMFPLSYGLLNLWYWYSYYDTQLVFNWTDPGFDDLGLALHDKNPIAGAEKRQGL